MSARPLIWVDDDPRERFDYEISALEESGWSVAWAGDVLAAAQRLSREPFEAVILDQEMAGEGVNRGNALFAGYRLLCWLRKSKLDVRIVEPAWASLESMFPLGDNMLVQALFLSSYLTDDLRNLDKNANVLANAKFLSKPIEPEKLVAYVNTVTPRL